jgi:NarL family two-component system response regulator LiaR
MKRHVLMYGLIGGILIALLQWTEYQFLVVEHSIEIYGGLIAATFAVLGIWLGLKLTAKRQTIVVREVPVPARDRSSLDRSSLTKENVRTSISLAVSLRSLN